MTVANCKHDWHELQKLWQVWTGTKTAFAAAHSVTVSECSRHLRTAPKDAIIRAMDVRAVAVIAESQRAEYTAELRGSQRAITALRRLCTEDLGLEAITIHTDLLAAFRNQLSPSALSEVEAILSNPIFVSRETLPPVDAAKILLACVRTSAEVLGPASAILAIALDQGIGLVIGAVAAALRRQMELGRVTDAAVRVLLGEIDRSLPAIRQQVVEIVDVEHKKPTL